MPASISFPTQSFPTPLRPSQPSPKKQMPLANGLVAGLGIACPLSYSVTIIDRALTQRANGSKTLSQGLRDGLRTSLRHPIKQGFKPEQKAVFLVYAATYATKNTSYALTEDHPIPKMAPLALTTIVNSSLGMWKDHRIARLFGKPNMVFPFVTYASFFTRDSFTVGSAFGIAPKASQYLQDHYGLQKGQADVATQLGCPMLAQIGATPFHFLGLDYANRSGVPLSERIPKVLHMSTGGIPVRMFRQGVVFGFGALGNQALLNWLSNR